MSVNFSENEYMVYGRTVAFNFVLKTNKSDIPTITIEASRVVRNNNKVSASWDKKVAFQLEADRELIQVANLILTGSHEPLEFKFHGVSKNKSLLIKNQEDSLYLSLNDGSRRDPEDRNFSAKLPLYVVFHLKLLLVKAISTRYKVDQNLVVNFLKGF